MADEARSYTRADIELIVLETVAGLSKEVQRTGTVSALDPLTVSLDGGGESNVTLVDPSLSVPVTVGLRVKLDWIGTGYMITGLAAAPGAMSVAPTELPDNCINRVAVVCPSWPDVPAGWALMDGGTYAGKFGQVTTPNWCDGRMLRAAQPGTTDPGATGGSSTHAHGITASNAHDHGGNTGTQNEAVLAVTSGGTAARLGNHSHPINSGGVHTHGGSTVDDSTLPPWRAVAWITWIGVRPTAAGGTEV